MTCRFSLLFLLNNIKFSARVARRYFFDYDINSDTAYRLPKSNFGNKTVTKGDDFIDSHKTGSFQMNKQGLTTEQAQLYVELRRLIDGFRYKDSENKRSVSESAVSTSFDIEAGYKTQYLSSYSPESRILENWYEYLGATLIEGQPKNLKDAVKDTETERRDYLETLEFFMRHKPTGDDLKELLGLSDKYDEIIENINEDIKRLM